MPLPSIVTVPFVCTAASYNEETKIETVSLTATPSEQIPSGIMTLEFADENLRGKIKVDDAITAELRYTDPM